MSEYVPGGEETATTGDGAPHAPTSMSPRIRSFALAIDRGILGLARHWLLFVNLLAGLYFGLALLGPWLRARGSALPADALYLFYGLSCHQLPERSFFVFGEKMCFCQRCAAIYGGGFILGMLYALARGRLRPLRWRWMFLLWAPMALDGFTQLFGWRESTWELRVITGSLFALSCVWVAFPYLEAAFGEMRDQIGARFARLDAPGPQDVATGA